MSYENLTGADLTQVNQPCMNDILVFNKMIIHTHDPFAINTPINLFLNDRTLMWDLNELFIVVNNAYLICVCIITGYNESALIAERDESSVLLDEGINCNGIDDVIMPSKGAYIVEWDWRVVAFNYIYGMIKAAHKQILVIWVENDRRDFGFEGDDMYFLSYEFRMRNFPYDQRFVVASTEKNVEMKMMRVCELKRRYVVYVVL